MSESKKFLSYLFRHSLQGFVVLSFFHGSSLLAITPPSAPSHQRVEADEANNVGNSDPAPGDNCVDTPHSLADSSVDDSAETDPSRVGGLSAGCSAASTASTFADGIGVGGASVVGLGAGASAFQLPLLNLPPPLGSAPSSSSSCPPLLPRGGASGEATTKEAKGKTGLGGCPFARPNVDWSQQRDPDKDRDSSGGAMLVISNFAAAAIHL